jgi:hypothetical protein
MPRIYIVFALLLSVTLLVSYEDNPPDGESGAPGDGLCTDCHTLDGGLQDGSIVLTGFPTSIEPNTAYFLTITNSNPNGLAGIAGFQMTILNSQMQVPFHILIHRATGNTGSISRPRYICPTIRFPGR